MPSPTPRAATTGPTPPRTPGSGPPPSSPGASSSRHSNLHKKGRRRIARRLPGTSFANSFRIYQRLLRADVRGPLLPVLLDVGSRGLHRILQVGAGRLLAVDGDGGLVVGAEVGGADGQGVGGAVELGDVTADLVGLGLGRGGLGGGGRGGLGGGLFRAGARRGLGVDRRSAKNQAGNQSDSRELAHERLLEWPGDHLRPVVNGSFALAAPTGAEFTRDLLL